MKLFDEYPYLENEYIVIHKLRPEDAEPLRKLTEDPLVSRYLPSFLYELKYEDKALVIEREEEEYFRTGEGIMLGIYIRRAGADAPEIFVGLAEIYGYEEERSKASIGDRILPEFWGKGISTNVVGLLRDYLIDDLGLRIVTAHILPDNLASAACVLKNGFIRKFPGVPENWGFDELCPTDKYVYKRYFRYKQERKMKVLLVNGSSHEKRDTYEALKVVEKSLNDCGIDTEWFWIGDGPVRGCIDCASCEGVGRCVFTDDCVNDLIEAMIAADGVIIGTPVYFCAPNGALMAILNRVFYAGSEYGGRLFEGKPAAAVATMWRSGGNTAVAMLSKYFAISGMPIIPSNYWNMVFSPRSEIADDKFGKEVLAKLGEGMAEMLLRLNGGRQ